VPRDPKGRRKCQGVESAKGMVLATEGAGCKGYDCDLC
jgi:hypothetical protein